MRVTQGAFSFLPELTDEEIEAQLRYAIGNGWSISIEYTDDPHPRNSYWELWGLPLFDLQTSGGAQAALAEVQACREAYPGQYVKVSAYDASYGRQTTALSFIVNRPVDEPGFRLERRDGRDRQIQYTLQPYSANEPPGRRYGATE